MRGDDQLALGRGPFEDAAAAGGRLLLAEAEAAVAGGAEDLQKAMPTGAWPGVLDDEVTAAALPALHTDPAAPWTDERLAAEAGVSRPRHTLASIARRVGYGSPYALSHAFSREFGTTPGRYRARLQATADDGARTANGERRTANGKGEEC